MMHGQGDAIQSSEAKRNSPTDLIPRWIILEKSRSIGDWQDRQIGEIRGLAMNQTSMATKRFRTRFPAVEGWRFSRKSTSQQRNSPLLLYEQYASFSYRDPEPCSFITSSTAIDLLFRLDKFGFEERDLLRLFKMSLASRDCPRK